jgi:dTDP-4-amino-4,6-dideoxygalactose transaminase
LTYKPVLDRIRETERFIRTSGLFGRRAAFLTGRGASALMLLYDALGESGGRVILPAIGCPSLLATVVLSGRKPVVVDVDRDLNIDPDRVDEEIRPGDIVLAVHIFGIPCDILRLEKICRENGAMLIEDVAQAVGGRIPPDDRPLGTFGDASILSFAEGKILPTHGGGLILTDDGNLASTLEDMTENLPKRPSTLVEKSRELRDELTIAFNKARRGNIEAASEWASLIDVYRDIYSCSIEPGELDAIVDALGSLGDIAANRRSGVEIYKEHLSLPGVEHLEYPDGCSPFRYTFLLPEFDGSTVQDITDAIRAEGMHASNLYLPLHWLAPEKVDDAGCPRAELAGVRMINLWLDDGIPERDARKVSEILDRWVR